MDEWQPKRTDARYNGYSDSDYPIRYKYADNQVDSKHWWQSKTIWFNVIVIGAGLATSAIPALEQHLSPDVYGVIASGVAFINAILRLLTNKSISRGKEYDE